MPLSKEKQAELARQRRAQAKTSGEKPSLGEQAERPIYINPSQQTDSPGPATQAREKPGPALDKKHYGSNTPDPWGDADPLEKPAAPGDREIPPEILELVAQTQKLLHRRGWDLWKCRNLNNDIVVIALNDKIQGYPPNLPVYTEAELREIAGVNLKTRRLIHESKKWGATILPGMRES